MIHNIIRNTQGYKPGMLALNGDNRDDIRLTFHEKEDALRCKIDAMYEAYNLRRNGRGMDTFPQDFSPYSAMFGVHAYFMLAIHISAQENKSYTDLIKNDQKPNRTLEAEALEAAFRWLELQSNETVDDLVSKVEEVRCMESLKAVPSALLDTASIAGSALLVRTSRDRTYLPRTY